MIEVTRKSDDAFEVVVGEGDDTTRHIVTLDDDYHRKLTNGSVTKPELIRRSFEFLLEREPKESILSKFNLRLINRYFASYETEIGL
ncbi:MAG: hypothetical protein J7M08_08430 [Planctomycetes bacterium]|nr:hypothetical protein [Planctomycetota bacterium]